MSLCEGLAWFGTCISYVAYISVESVCVHNIQQVDPGQRTRSSNKIPNKLVVSVEWLCSTGRLRKSPFTPTHTAGESAARERERESKGEGSRRWQRFPVFTKFNDFPVLIFKPRPRPAPTKKTATFHSQIV